MIRVGQVYRYKGDHTCSIKTTFLDETVELEWLPPDDESGIYPTFVSFSAVEKELVLVTPVVPLDEDLFKI